MIAEIFRADYDLMSFDKPHENPKDYLISSYVYRKALIRKHQLHLTIMEYLAKARDRGYKSLLDSVEGGWPLGWNVEIQFADELDEMWVDELYELAEVLQRNEEVEEDQRQYVSFFFVLQLSSPLSGSHHSPVKRNLLERVPLDSILMTDGSSSSLDSRIEHRG